MSNIISRPFRFTEHQHYIAPSADESTWSPIAPAVKVPALAPPLVLKKFVYVFQRLGSTFSLYQELYSDADGKLATYSGRDARAQERDSRGPFVPLGSDAFTLPHTVNGQRAYYTFLLSRIRLPADSIRAVESRPPKGIIREIDLASDGAYLAVARDTATATETDWWLGVTDAATIAFNLHEAYERACNELLFFTSEYKEQSAEQRQRVVERHKTLLLAKLLKSVFEGDPNDKLGLENELRFGRNHVTKFVTDYENTLDHLIKQRDSAGEHLCNFLGGSLLDLIEQSYRFVEAEEYHRWLEIYSACMERLNECPMGKARLGKLATSPNYAVREYILRTSVAPDTQFGIGRKCTAAIVNLWGEFAPAMLAKNMPDAAKRLTDALKNIAKVTIVESRVKTQTYTYKKKNGKLRTVTTEGTELVKVLDVEKTLSKWAKEGAPGKALERLTMGIEVINLMLAIRSWHNADPQESTLAAISAFGSLLDAVSAWKCILKLKERSAKAVGALSAVIDAAFAIQDGRSAYDRDDTSSAVGYGAIALGSVLTFFGCLCGAAGLAASTTVVGIPLGVFLEVVGAVLIAAGWLVAILTGDSDLEQFVSHSKFGVNYPSSSRDPENKPKWATAVFADWSHATTGLDHQINSLMKLLGAFHMKAVDANKVRVTLGLVTEESKLKMHFKTKHSPGITHETELLIDLSSKTTTHLRGDPQDMKRITFGEADRRMFVEVEAYWSKEAIPSIPHAQVWRCDCDILLMLDGKLTVPTAGPFPYLVSLWEKWSVLGAPQSSYD